ncbi:MAG: helix-turn-helix transcriptional regulator [Clostridia bacterium]|nr:helix-turn-helix transcriptional regulator [Clostridia bacterium]
MSNRTILGARIAELRYKKDLRQFELGELIGEAIGISLSPSAIGQYERGARNPPLEVVEAISDIFNVSIDYLFGKTDEKLTVDKYLKLDKIELERLLKTKNVTFQGKLLTEQDKERILDIAFALFWKDK